MLRRSTQAKRGQCRICGLISNDQGCEGLRVRGAAQASYGSSKVYGASELAGNIYVVDQGDKREGQLIGPYGIGTRQHRAAIAGRQSVLRARYDAAL